MKRTPKAITKQRIFRLLCRPSFLMLKVYSGPSFFLFTTILRIFLTKLLCHSYSTEFQHHTFNEKSSKCFKIVGISPLNSILFVLIQQYIHSQVFELLFRNAQIILFLWYILQLKSCAYWIGICMNIIHCYIVWVTLYESHVNQLHPLIYWRTVYRFLIRSMLLSPYKLYFM